TPGPSPAVRRPWAAWPCATPPARPGRSGPTAAPRARRAPASRALDGEPGHVRVGLAGVEGLAHHHDLLRHLRGPEDAGLLHALLRIGHQVDLVDDVLVAHLAL